MMKIPRAFVGWEVLVVDDEQDNLEVASRLLKIAGATVTMTSNGVEALQKVQARSAPYKFVLSDLSMPDMDGWELLYLLQQEKVMQNIPVIALTAHAMAGDRERCIAAGFLDHISKPLDPMSFIQQIIKLLTPLPDYAPLLETV